MNWRDEARAVIERAYGYGRMRGLEGTALRKHINAAYPFGERKYHPYKIWCDELNKQLGSVRKGTRGEREKLDAWNKGEPIR